ncbi:hypothetical protein GCM10007159_16780 [Modicisalibacter luteus]|nr:hypothetical protein GCM10007159_16780 [Halomonas lutea]
MDLFILAGTRNPPGEVESIRFERQLRQVVVIDAQMWPVRYQVGRSRRGYQIEQPDRGLGAASLMGKRDSVFEESPAKDVTKRDRAGLRRDWSMLV